MPNNFFNSCVFHLEPKSTSQINFGLTYALKWSVSAILGVFHRIPSIHSHIRAVKQGFGYN